MPAPEQRHDLVVTGARLVATMDGARRELPGGWVAVRDGLISAVGDSTTVVPRALIVLDATDGLVTPGFVNTHHHIYQNLTRAFAPALDGDLFHWLRTLYPVWSRLDEEASYVSAFVGLVELALGGCTTTSDHLYVHPRGRTGLVDAEIRAALDVGMRFHPTRGSMSLGESDGGLPPDAVVQDDDEILADSERLVAAHHDASHGALVRIALAPCSPFSVTPRLMIRTAELAERLDVRLHTHIAEDAAEDEYCAATFGRRPIDHLDAVGWVGGRTWVAHCVNPAPNEIALLGSRSVGVAHCPSSNQLIGAGLAPIAELRAAGVPVGLGCDGSASTDCASLWLEARAALLLGRLRGGAAGMRARDVLEMATRGGAACLGRSGEIGELTIGAVADLVVWPLDGISFAGALSDPVEALLRCGPVAARHTVVAGRILVRDGRPLAAGLDEMLRRHRELASEWLAAAM